MSEGPLAAVVARPRAEAAIAALRAEGVYDDDRSVYECGDETVAVPVTGHPEATDVLEVVREAGDPRLRTLEDHLRERGWSEDELERAPGSWAVVGSVVLVDVGDAPHSEDAAEDVGSGEPSIATALEDVGESLLALHGQADTVLARGGIAGSHREPDVTVIAGEGDTETVHVEHGTTYAMDLAEVMFSPGNKAERGRMGEVVRGDEGSGSPERASGDGVPASREADGERVLDAFAGIGYFALPMARAGAEVTAVERNPAAFEYLLENAMCNDVTERIHAYRGDNREVVPELAAGGERFDRAVMGHYDAWESLAAVLPALAGGGTVHLHEATPADLVPDRPVSRLEDAAAAAGRAVDVADVRRVKGYSEGVDHVVVDARID